ncbi:hypothetical protein F4778DRAFT_309930 [Xylariomycetidae sp. FL2044]|nr:hypothetical protein F4778DRAFT_309930 [Xylariomycetidae sp. FL2044]
MSHPSSSSGNAPSRDAGRYAKMAQPYSSFSASNSSLSNARQVNAGDSGSVGGKPTHTHLAHDSSTRRILRDMLREVEQLKELIGRRPESTPVTKSAHRDNPKEYDSSPHDPSRQATRTQQRSAQSTYSATRPVATRAQPGGQSRYAMVKESFGNNVDFMHSYGLKPYDVDDCEEADDILDQMEEYDRLHHDQPGEDGSGEPSEAISDAPEDQDGDAEVGLDSDHDHIETYVPFFDVFEDNCRDGGGPAEDSPSDDDAAPPPPGSPAGSSCSDDAHSDRSASVGVPAVADDHDVDDGSGHISEDHGDVVNDVADGGAEDADVQGDDDDGGDDDAGDNGGDDYDDGGDDYGGFDDGDDGGYDYEDYDDYDDDGYDYDDDYY